MAALRTCTQAKMASCSGRSSAYFSALERHACLSPHSQGKLKQPFWAPHLVTIGGNACTRLCKDRRLAQHKPRATWNPFASRPGKSRTQNKRDNPAFSPLDSVDHLPKARYVLDLPLTVAIYVAKWRLFWQRQRRKQQQEVMEGTPMLRKLVPLGVIFFCASFNYTVLQNLKDAIMVTAGGAETLPFLASFVVLPASIGFFLLYNQMVSILPERYVFYAAVMPLLIFYTIFATVLYPAAPMLHPYGMVDNWMAHCPQGLHGLLKVIANWTFSIFFCLAELYGAIVISVLFWSLANEVCNVDEAKTIYPLMGISANIALVIGGGFMRLVTMKGSLLASLRIMVGTILGLSAIMFAAKAYVDFWVLPECSEDEPCGIPSKKSKTRSSLSESWQIIRNSPKIGNLAVLVVAYGVGHRLFEFCWKGQLRNTYPGLKEYQGVLADVSSLTGMVTLAMMLLSGFIFKRLGWSIAAAITPIMMLISGATFFSCTYLLQCNVAPVESLAVIGAVGSVAGVVTQVCARSSKYALFDPAKEMVYIEMDKKEKKRGKAAVDLVGSQIGKSGASWITQALLLGLGSLAGALPFMSCFFVVVILMWVKATFNLGHSMKHTDSPSGTATLESMEEMEPKLAPVNLQNNHSAAASLNPASAIIHKVSVRSGLQDEVKGSIRSNSKPNGFNHNGYRDNGADTQAPPNVVDGNVRTESSILKD